MSRETIYLTPVVADSDRLALLAISAPSGESRRLQVYGCWGTFPIVERGGMRAAGLLVANATSARQSTILLNGYAQRNMKWVTVRYVNTGRDGHAPGERIRMSSVHHGECSIWSD